MAARPPSCCAALRWRHMARWPGPPRRQGTAGNHKRLKKGRGSLPERVVREQDGPWPIPRPYFDRWGLSVACPAPPPVAQSCYLQLPLLALSEAAPPHGAESALCCKALPLLGPGYSVPAAPGAPSLFLFVLLLSPYTPPGISRIDLFSVPQHISRLLTQRRSAPPTTKQFEPFPSLCVPAFYRSRAPRRRHALRARPADC